MPLGAAEPNYAGRTLTLWDYEADDSAMGIAWNAAIKEFEAKTGREGEVPGEGFEQIKPTRGMILNSDSAPDVMEYNKGNATAGLLSKQGLLTDLTPAVASTAGTRSSARACRRPRSTTRRASWAPASGTASRTTAST